MSSTWTGWRKPREHVGILVDRCIDARFTRELNFLPGIRAASLAEMYGHQAALNLEDVVFLADAGRHGWCVWTQNPQMWHVDIEQQVIIQNGTRVFSLGSAQYSNVAKGFVFGRHWQAIRRRLQRAEPCFWRLYPESKRKSLA